MSEALNKGLSQRSEPYSVVQLSNIVDDHSKRIDAMEDVYKIVRHIFHVLSLGTPAIIAALLTNAPHDSPAGHLVQWFMTSHTIG